MKPGFNDKQMHNMDLGFYDIALMHTMDLGCHDIKLMHKMYLPNKNTLLNILLLLF